MNSYRFNTRCARVKGILRAAKNAKEDSYENDALQTQLEAQLFRYDIGLSLLLWYQEGTQRDMVAEVSFIVRDPPGMSKEHAFPCTKTHLIATSDKPNMFPDSLHTQSEESWQQALQWTQHCSKFHLDCNPQNRAEK